MITIFIIIEIIEIIAIVYCIIKIEQDEGNTVLYILLIVVNLLALIGNYARWE